MGDDSFEKERRRGCKNLYTCKVRCHTLVVVDAEIFT